MTVATRSEVEWDKDDSLWDSLWLATWAVVRLWVRTKRDKYYFMSVYLGFCTEATDIIVTLSSLLRRRT